MEQKIHAMEDITDKEKLYSFLEKCGSSEDNLIFRGVRKENYKLLPSIGRFKKNDDDKEENLTTDDEKLLLKLFKQKAHSFVTEHLDNDLALLSIAQHHGLPTRLLDWTRNPLVAIYFAVKDDFQKWEEPTNSEESTDSLVYVFSPKSKVDLDSDFNPFEITDIRRYVPKYWNPRIIAQEGLFTVHPKPLEPYDSEEDIKKVKIKKGELRREIKRILYKFGINQGSLFPDLDGISSHIKWLRTNVF